MGNGRNHNFVIQTRQKDDELFRLDSADPKVPQIAAGGTAEFPIRRVAGYGSIRFLVMADQVMRLRIEEAPTPQGPWVETSRLTAAASTSGSGQFFICADVSPCGVFMRIFLDNTGLVAVTADLSGLGHPVAGGGGSGGGGGGGGSFPPNQPTFAVNQVVVPFPGTAVPLDAQAVPNGFQIFVRALVANNGIVYVGPTAADAQNHAKATPLEPGAFLEMALTNVNAIFIDADTANDGVSWTVEVA